MADIFDALKPCLRVSQAIGLAPFSLDSDGKRLNISKLGLAFSFLILIIYAGNSGWVLYELLFKDSHRDPVDNILEVNEKCQVACGVGVTLITMLLMIIQRNKVTSVVNTIHQIDNEMLKLNITAPYESMAKISLIQMACLLAYLIFLSLHGSFVWYDWDQNAAAWITLLAPGLYNFIMEFQFIMGALLLKKHFTLLNAYLTTITGKVKGDSIGGKELTENYSDGSETFLGPKLIDPSFIAWDGNFSRFRPRKEIGNGLPGKQTHLSNIKVFRKVHSNLCDVKEHLNSAYSLQLLASVAQAFVIITSDLYLLFTSLSDSGFVQIAWLSYPAVWTITHVLELIFIVVTCTKTSKQANQTAIVVHKLLARDCDPDLRNQVINLDKTWCILKIKSVFKREPYLAYYTTHFAVLQKIASAHGMTLKLFSIQLLHRKISFSACGFFTLDMTLLQAIIGAATTYLVILIQFHLGTKPPATAPTN